MAESAIFCKDSGSPLVLLPKHLRNVDFKGLFFADSGEYFPFDANRDKHHNPTFDSALSRAKRWALKSVVSTILPKSRTSNCMVLRSPSSLGGLNNIELCKSPRLNKAYYQGLFSCGSIWTCPICAAKISERRRQELKDALRVAINRDFNIHFVTLTFPHGAGDDLKDILKKMSKAYGKLSSGEYSVKNQLASCCDENKIHGFIRAVEVTHGRNGFHPHVHMIVFTDKGTTSNILEYLYKKAWERACRLSGLPKPNGHGCTVKDGSYAAEYVSKWGIEDEMTKANQKTTKVKGQTPWGLLRCCLDGDDLDYPKERAAKLFSVYAQSFSGKRQLYWSNGLRSLLNMSKEISDSELAELPDDEITILLASITVEQWKIIRKNKQQANLLTIAETNAPNVKPFIESLMCVS